MTDITDDTPTPLRTVRAILWEPRGVRIFAFFVTVMTSVMAFAGIGSSVPLESHEVFVARTAMEMSRRGDYVVPYFNDEPRLKKPPLNYWLVIAAHRAFSDSEDDFVTEFQARLPSALAGIGLVIATMALGAVAFQSGRVGVTAGALVMTSRGFLTYAHSARPEMLYSLFCSLGILAFIALYRVRNSASRGRRFALGAAAWLSIAVALLAKGPFLPVFILIGLAFGLLLVRRGRAIIPVLRPITGLVIILMVVLPWYWLVVQRQDALEFWRGEMFGRMGGSDQWWYQPLSLYYLRKTPLLLLPWLVLIPGAIVLPWRLRGQAGRVAKLLLCLIATPMVILSFSKGSSWYYMLPLVPCMAVLLAAYGVRAFDRLERIVTGCDVVKRVIGVHAVVFIIIAAVAIVGILLSQRGAHLGAVAVTVWTAFILLGIVLALLAWTRPSTHNRPAIVLLIACLFFVGVAAQGSGIAWRVDRRLADRTFARQLAEAVEENRLLFGIGCEIATIVHYANRPIERVSRRHLAARLSETPDALVLTKRRAITSGILTGDITLEQPMADADDAFLLLRNAQPGDPSPSPTDPTANP